MKVRSLLVWSAVILGLGAAQVSARAAGQIAGGAAPAPAAAALPAVGKAVLTQTCPISYDHFDVICEEGCHAGLNESICSDMEKVFRSCISMKCAHIKADDPEGKMPGCLVWAGRVCARVMGCRFIDDSGSEAQ